MPNFWFASLYRINTTCYYIVLPTGPMICPTDEIQNNQSISPFRKRPSLPAYTPASAGSPLVWTAEEARRKSVENVFRYGFNEQFWRHGIVISQGNKMSVSKDDAIRRLDSLRRHLGRRMFGNKWREKAQITFVLFQHGSRETFNEHYHALLGIGGDHEWTDFGIAMAINLIEGMRHRRRSPNRRWEKIAHVDWNWARGNRYHSYVGRFANKRPDNWEII
jgi:hypothetical protein